MRNATPPEGAMPERVDDDLRRLVDALAAELPAKTAGNLIIGTWNIRALSGLTEKWESADGDSPKRDWRAVSCIAEVIKRFDVTAIQEGRRDTTALFAVLNRLGPRFQVIVSDVTEGPAGNGERLAYIYDSQRLEPSGLVGEIVLPPATTADVEQFARTPYAASFTRGSTDFVLTTVHVLWGDEPEDRIGELTAFAEWMRAWADRPTDWNGNLLVLGDFNLDRIGDPLFDAFVSTGLWPPAELNGVPRTIFSGDEGGHFYDQIAWFVDTDRPDMPSLLDGIAYTGRGGGFDFTPHVLQEFTKQQASWRLSDHYPLWVEFTLES